jgi:hypothetical protein
MIMPVNPASPAPRPASPGPDRTPRDVARRLPGRILGIDVHAAVTALATRTA